MDTDFQREICLRVAQARREAGLTQEEIANILNLTVRAYQNYERDRAPFRRLAEIARITDVTPEWLLRGQEAPVTADLADLLREHEDEAERSRAAAVAALESIDDRLSRIEAALGLQDARVEEE